MDLTIHFCFSNVDPAAQLLRWEIDMRLEDKIALVTGSTRGVHAAAARVLAGEGSQVIGFRFERVARSRRRGTTADR
jgi:trans-2-enoyl-CoA reductase